jgi:SAM-dependent methyltransferase
MTNHSVREVRDYWDSHLNLTQFLPKEEGVAVGSDESYHRLEEALRRYEYKTPLLERFAKGEQGHRLLEVGCGLGVELATLGTLGFRVTGIDLGSTAVLLSNRYLKRQGIPGRALVQNAEEMAFDEDSFDAVYSSGVLQHTPNIRRAIAEIHRVLKPGGRILIILYHRYSWFNLLRQLSGVRVEFESDDAPIINTYRPKELKVLFHAFRDVRVHHEYYYPRPTRRKGTLAFLFNRVFVPVMRALPRRVVRKAGWHLVLTGRK